MVEGGRRRKGEGLEGREDRCKGGREGRGGIYIDVL